MNQRRLEGLIKKIRNYKQATARRLSDTRKLFGKRVYAVDIHTHSTYSDGVGTVSDNYRHAKSSGLDFIFATDHRRIGQKRVVRKRADASWGQEPGAGSHHIGVLCNKRIFRPSPKKSLNENLLSAKKIAPFTWIPHPIGWYSSSWYTDETISMLWDVGDSFAMEVINGAGKLIRAYDQFDAKAVNVWDRLLCDGKRVAAIGGSDSHCPEQIGNVWSGVFARTRTADSIIKALNNALCFASESALLDFSCNNLPVGSILRKRKGTKLHLRFRVADTAGISLVRIVSQGKALKEIDARGESLVEGDMIEKADFEPRYYRLESVSNDDLRAFSTPIYVEPTS